MSIERSPRIANAIHSLIDHLVINDSHKSKQDSEERHDACFQLAQSTLER